MVDPASQKKGALLFRTLIHLLFIGCMAVAVLCYDASGLEAKLALQDDWKENDRIGGNPGEAEKKLSPWFIMPTVVNVYPRLESERLISRYYNPVMKVLAPGFRDVRTVGSLRDEHLLWTPSLSIGRVVSPHLALYVQFGYSAGKVRTKKQDTSILLVPLHTDFEIYRSAAYFGVCADIYPWGMPERREYHGFWDRLKSTKPSIGLRLTQTYAQYKVKVKNSFARHFRFLNLEMKDAWWVASANANIGADVPLGKHDALSANAGYNLSFSRDFDFDGAAFTVGWKHYF